MLAFEIRYPVYNRMQRGNICLGFCIA